MRQEDSCFCEAKVSPVALSTIPVSVNWLSDKRYLCVRINYQAGSFSRQSKSRYDRRLYIEKLVCMALQIRIYIKNERITSLMRHALF